MTALGVDLLSRKKNDHPRAVFVINRGHPAPNQRLKNKLSLSFNLLASSRCD
jgi:hypothetical protein